MRMAAIRVHPLVIVVVATGSGKSARLLTRLQEEKQHVRMRSENRVRLPQNSYTVALLTREDEGSSGDKKSSVCRDAGVKKRRNV